MRAKYCLDTSGLSNPIMDLPEDIYVSLWEQVAAKLIEGLFYWNVEIADELKGIFGRLGEIIQACDAKCCLEVGVGDWPWERYLATVEELRVKYNGFISEYNGNRKDTVGLNDISIIALAKVTGLPVVSMERESRQQSGKKMRIPDVCKEEGVLHMTFNDFLRAEGITRRFQVPSATC